MWIGRPLLTVSVAKIRRKSWGGEPQRGSVDVDDGGSDGQVGEHASDPRRRDDVESVLVGADRSTARGSRSATAVARVRRGL